MLATLLRFFVNRPQMIIVIVCGMSQRKKNEPVLFTEVIHVTSPPVVVRDADWMTNRITAVRLRP